MTAAHENTRSDILVAGVGATGLAAALAFARAGCETTLAGRIPPPLPGRTVALVRILRAISRCARRAGARQRRAAAPSKRST